MTESPRPCQAEPAPTAVAREDNGTEPGDESRNVSQEGNTLARRRRRPLWVPVVIVIPGDGHGGTLTVLLSVLATVLPPAAQALRQRRQ
ncbi:hypothetical protein LN042_35100 [Kitasatospora sp. RB6PN24]|uniref:hypothetical protein n=1 Tax=Kitasatospora humi TaxID=2893891 RepID=UPI001E61D585|nr:hypothetical protein [Kitasatospora humi]MCC9312231.1 hypothetical protein [Kitasatospora humi]